LCRRLKPGGDLALGIVLGLGDLVIHLIDDPHRHREAAKQVEPLDARKRQHRTGVRDNYGDVEGSAGHVRHCSTQLLN
jgi:hypothetical protein